MPKLNISQLPEQEFTSDDIDNCFYVEDMNQPNMKVVTLKSVFNQIKDRAIQDEGLTVEFTGSNIIFIKGKKI